MRFSPGNLIAVFTATIFTSATLLFLSEPMIAKMILPKFGGTPAVWVTCMLFFQLQLLIGYTYSHLLTKYLPVRKQVMVHSVVVAVPLLIFLVIPLGIYQGFEPPGDAYFVVYVLLLLTELIGMPFLILSTTAPLIQKWFSYTGHPSAKDPYFLYSASNFGSMLALLAYPALVEPLTTLTIQGIFWMLGFAVFAGLMIYCGLQVKDAPEPAAETNELPATVKAEKLAKFNGEKQVESEEEADGENEMEAEGESEQFSEKPLPATRRKPRKWRKKEKARVEAITKDANIRDEGPIDADAEPPPLTKDPTFGSYARWIMLAFVPSSLMLGLSTYVTTDIAAVPLLWIPPLFLYLLSFILVFSKLDTAMKTWGRRLSGKDRSRPASAAIPMGWIFGSVVENGLHGMMVLTLPVVVLLLIFMVVSDVSIWIVWKLCLHFVLLFIVAMVCHGELARSRPPTKFLTAFYLAMSVGGVMGGLFNAIVAPFIFNSIAEYHLVMAIACMLMPPIETDKKSKLNLAVDIGLGAGMGIAALFVMFKWLALRWGDELMPNWTELGNGLKGAFTLPGMEPGGLNLVFVLIGVIALFAYVVIPRRTDQRTGPSPYEQIPIGILLLLIVFVGGILPGALGLFAYIAYYRKSWEGRFLDVAEPAALLLLTSLLMSPETFGMEQPFKRWQFQSFQEAFGVDRDRIIQVLTYGLPVALCYGFAEQPIRFGLGVGAILLASGMQADNRNVLHQERTFFGVLKVENQQYGGYHRLLHGTTLHGMQRFASAQPTMPPLLMPLMANDPLMSAADTLFSRDWSDTHRPEALTYYHRTGPVGLSYMPMLSGEHSRDNVAFIGLGTGTMASYGNLGQNVTFYEIDPSMVRIASNPDYFTYLRDALGNVKFDMGDARLRMKHADDHKYRYIIVDAFSSDAIPVHLITKEAIQLYMDKLQEDGVAAIHISNRYLRLGPVLGNIAKDLNLAAIRMYDGEADLGGMHWGGKNASDWVIMARKPEYLQRIKLFDRFTNLRKLPHQELGKKAGDVDPKYFQEKDRFYTAMWQADVLATMLGGNQMHLLIDDPRWEKLEASPDQAMWTDDFSNIISIFRWKD